jgi:ketosteroid isomerase-like protein
MPEENIEIARRAIDAWDRRDRTAWRSVHDRDLRVIPDRAFPEQNEISGREAAWEYYVEINEPFERNPIGDARIAEAGPDTVLIHHRMVPRGRASGAEFAADAWDLVTIVDGRIVSERWFFDRAEALEAAGL